MLRKIILIDEDKCNGCGKCVPNCAEGALQIIDGKARLISDLFCDGLGACIGYCPESAITVIEREAEPYDESKVMENVVKGGRNVIKAHLEHLKNHQELELLAEALDYLKENGLENPLTDKEDNCRNDSFSGCPGSQIRFSEDKRSNKQSDSKRQNCELNQWPIQMHLINPLAPYFKNSHLLLCADCAGIAYPNFHSDFLKGKSLAIACPKLDTNKQVYLDKLISMIENSNLQSIEVLIMEVPCCGGLFQMAKQAVEHSARNIPVKPIVITIDGKVRE